MSDNWRFDPSDFGGGGSSDTSTASRTSNNASGGALALLPLTVIAVYAFVETSVVLSAVQSIIGQTLLAVAITKAFWIVGAIVVVFFGIIALLTAVNLLIGLFARSVPNALVGMLGFALFGLLWSGATYLFGSLPLLVGMTLTATLLAYGIVLAILLVLGSFGSLTLVA